MRLRPYLSDNGPQNTELTLKYIKNTYKDKVTSGTEQFSCSLIDGNAGKYKSVDSGGNDATIATSTIIILSDSCLDFLLSASEFPVTDFFIIIIYKGARYMKVLSLANAQLHMQQILKNLKFYYTHLILDLLDLSFD